MLVILFVGMLLGGFFLDSGVEVHPHQVLLAFGHLDPCM